MFSLADSNFYYLSFFMNTGPGEPGVLVRWTDSCNVTLQKNLITIMVAGFPGCWRWCWGLQCRSRESWPASPSVSSDSQQPSANALLTKRYPPVHLLYFKKICYLVQYCIKICRLVTSTVYTNKILK